MTDVFWAAVAIALIGVVVVMALVAVVTNPALMFPYLAASVLIALGLAVLPR